MSFVFSFPWLEFWLGFLRQLFLICSMILGILWDSAGQGECVYLAIWTWRRVTITLLRILVYCCCLPALFRKRFSKISEHIQNMKKKMRQTWTSKRCCCAFFSILFRSASSPCSVLLLLLLFWPLLLLLPSLPMPRARRAPRVPKPLWQNLASIWATYPFAARADGEQRAASRTRAECRTGRHDRRARHQCRRQWATQCGLAVCTVWRTVGGIGRGTLFCGSECNCSRLTSGQSEC